MGITVAKERIEELPDGRCADPVQGDDDVDVDVARLAEAAVQDRDSRPGVRSDPAEGPEGRRCRPVTRRLRRITASLIPQQGGRGRLSFLQLAFQDLNFGSEGVVDTYQRFDLAHRM